MGEKGGSRGGRIESRIIGSILLQVDEILYQVLHELVLLHHVALKGEHLANDALVLLGEGEDVILHLILYRR